MLKDNSLQFGDTVQITTLRESAMVVDLRVIDRLDQHLILVSLPIVCLDQIEVKRVHIDYVNIDTAQSRIDQFSLATDNLLSL